MSWLWWIFIWELIICIQIDQQCNKIEVGGIFQVEFGVIILGVRLEVCLASGFFFGTKKFSKKKVTRSNRLVRSFPIRNSHKKFDFENFWKKFFLVKNFLSPKIFLYQKKKKKFFFFGISMLDQVGKFFFFQIFFLGGGLTAVLRNWKIFYYRF